MMKKFALLCLLVLATQQMSAQVGEAEDVSEHVQTLTDANFEEFLNSADYVLVEFYAPWCGHCKSLAPEFEKAAAKLKETDPKVPLGKVDATENEKYAQQYKVEGFPTLFFFNKGEKIEYAGPRDAEGIVQWVLKKTGPISTEIMTAEGFEKLTSDNQAVLVFFGESVDSAEYKEFENLARATDGMFAHSLSAEVKKAAGVEASGNHLILFKQYDDLKNIFSGEWNIESMSGFIQKNINPTILNFDEQGAEIIFGGEQKEALFLIISDSQKSQDASAALDETKDLIKDKILLCRTGINDEMGQRLGEYLNLTNEDLPVLLVLNFKGEEDMKKYYHQAEIDSKNIIEFMDQYSSGLLEPTAMSEPVPEDNNGPVTVLVGTNFEEIVMDNDKDVLVKFYAPWCGHCQTLAPIYEELGQHFAEDSNIIIAKCDLTKNEIPGSGVEGFPTLKFYPARNGDMEQPILTYQGERSLEEMRKYVLEERKSQEKLGGQNTDSKSETKKDDL